MYGQCLRLQVTYQFVPFKNEARDDDLKLYHWVQCYKDATGTTRPTDDGPYPFAKYNMNAGAYRYDDIEYETIVRPALPESETGWSKVCVLSCASHVHVMICGMPDTLWQVFSFRPWPMDNAASYLHRPAHL